MWLYNLAGKNKGPDSNDLCLWCHSNSCMLDRMRAWPRSDCISVTSMALNVPTVVWPEIPTVPGTVSPAPDTTQLESTPRGTSTDETTSLPADVCATRLRYTSSPEPFSSIVSWMSHCSKAGPTKSSSHENQRYIIPISMHLVTSAPLLRFSHSDSLVFLCSSCHRSLTHWSHV